MEYVRETYYDDGGGPNFDFATNTGYLTDVANKVDAARRDIEMYKDALLGANGYIKQLGNYWQGDSYNVFHDKCYEYESTIEALIEFLEAYSKMIKFVEEESESLINNVAHNQAGRPYSSC